VRLNFEIHVKKHVDNQPHRVVVRYIVLISTDYFKITAHMKYVRNLYSNPSTPKQRLYCYNM